VVAEGHGLGGLQVGEARHEGVGMLLGAVQQGGLEALQLGERPVAGVADPEPEVHGHLVVPAARRVQAPRRRTDQLAQPGLHIHVDVLELVPEGEGPVADLGGDGVEAGLDGRLVLTCNHALHAQHRRVGAGAGQILVGKPPVEPDGDVDRLHQVGRTGREPAAPHGLSSLGGGVRIFCGVCGHHEPG